MDSFAPPASFSEAPAQAAVRTQAPAPDHDEKSKTANAPGPAAQAAAERLALRKAELSAEVLPDRLVIEKDEAANRFVQTLIDSQTEEVQFRYPSETQLAFSRAVAAYMRARSES